MSTYTQQTAALKATKIDVRNLNVKGKDVAKYFGQKVQTCKDTRQVITENDLWGTYVEVTDKGDVIFHDDYISNPNIGQTPSDSSAWNTEITRVQNNKAYIGDEFYCNIQTQKLNSAYDMFYNCENFTTWNSDLSSLVNGAGMFVGGSGIYDDTGLTSFTGDLSSLVIGNSMFKQTALTQFNVDSMPKLIVAREMFSRIPLLTFTTKVPSLLEGRTMFYACDLESFDSDLSSLINGFQMFRWDTQLKSFRGDLSSLINGDGMFTECGLEQWDTDLSSLETGANMFYANEFETFTSDLSSLTDGSTMFEDCQNLKHFNSGLYSLISGYGMFNYCNLDVDSFIIIADTINNLVEKGLAVKSADGLSWNYDTGDENWNVISSINFAISQSGNSFNISYNIQKKALHSSQRGRLDLYYDSSYEDGSDELNEIIELCQEIADKGWTVYLRTWGKGNTLISPTNQTSLDGETPVVKPLYYKPVPANEERGRYVNGNGEYFDIVGGSHIFGDDISTYGMFTSLEEAEQAMGLTKVVKERPSRPNRKQN